MSLLVLSRHGILAGSAEAGAGSSASEVIRLTVSALQSLKTRVRASSSLVFNDLQALATECNSDVREDPAFLLAQRFLLTLPGHLPAPELSLDSDGEVAFDWVGSGGRLLTLTLRADGRISYAARLSTRDSDYGTKQFVDSIPKRVLELVQQVTIA